MNLDSRKRIQEFDEAARAAGPFVSSQQQYEETRKRRAASTTSNRKRGVPVARTPEQSWRKETRPSNSEGRVFYFQNSI